MLSDAQVLELTLTAATVFVGIGATVDVGTASLDTSDAIGFTASVSTLTLVLVSDGTRTYTGLAVEGLSAELLGIDDLVARVSDVSVQVNRAADSALPPATTADKLDWAGFAPDPDELDLPELGGLTDVVDLHAEGDIAIDLFGFVVAVAGFSIEKHSVTGIRRSDGRSPRRPHRRQCADLHVDEREPLRRRRRDDRRRRDAR